MVVDLRGRVRERLPDKNLYFLCKLDGKEHVKREGEKRG